MLLFFKPITWLQVEINAHIIAYKKNYSHQILHFLWLQLQCIFDDMSHKLSKIVKKKQ